MTVAVVQYSTAVPGLAAKPVLDMLAEATPTADERRRILALNDPSRLDA